MKMFNIIVIIICLIGMTTLATGLIQFSSEDCSWSKYNVYTNMSGGIKLLNNCYIPTNTVITKTEKCGFLSIHCRDVEPYNVNRGGNVCFKLKTGELC